MHPNPNLETIKVRSDRLSSSFRQATDISGQQRTQKKSGMNSTAPPLQLLPNVHRLRCPQLLVVLLFAIRPPPPALLHPWRSAPRGLDPRRNTGQIWMNTTFSWKARHKSVTSQTVKMMFRVETAVKTAITQPFSGLDRPGTWGSCIGVRSWLAHAAVRRSDTRRCEWLVWIVTVWARNPTGATQCCSQLRLPRRREILAFATAFAFGRGQNALLGVKERDFTKPSHSRLDPGCHIWFTYTRLLERQTHKH